MKAIALIPARYAATRFPFKLMQPLGDKTVIRTSYENVLATALFDDVIVVADESIIVDEIVKHGGKAVLSKDAHESGSDRIAEAAQALDADIIVNVQGDEPFITRETLEKLLSVFSSRGAEEISLASPMKRIQDAALLQDRNIVKVVTDAENNALYFSRSPIPFQRDETFKPICFEHVGVYAFRRQALMDFTKWEPTPLEQSEKIECLRYLEHGKKIRMVQTNESSVKIDVPSDLAKAEEFLKRMRG